VRCLFQSAELDVDVLNLGMNIDSLLKLRWRSQLQARAVIDAEEVSVDIDSSFFDVGEEGGKLIEVSLFERIKLVVVALAAAESQAQPGRTSVAYPVGDVFRQVFLLLNARLGAHSPEAVVGGRNHLPLAGVRQQIAGELFDRELIEGHVRIEGCDHVIAVGGHLHGLVGKKADAVGVAHEVQPADRHPFSKVR